MSFEQFISFVKESFELTEEQVRRFEALDSLYREWNARINVISRKDIDGIYSHHVLHSLAIAKYLGEESLDTAQMVKSRVCRYGKEPRAEFPCGVKSLKSQKRFLETLHHHVVHVGLPLEIPAHAAADGLFIDLVDLPVGCLAAGDGGLDYFGFSWFHIQCASSQFFPEEHSTVRGMLSSMTCSMTSTTMALRRSTSEGRASKTSSS